MKQHLKNHHIPTYNMDTLDILISELYWEYLKVHPTH